jgi:hydrogenase nickel incorporation protein HypB
MCGLCGCGPDSDHIHSKHDHHASGGHDVVRIERDILAKNDRYAEENRKFFQMRGVLTVNLVSSPGSGKTTLLVRTATEMKGLFPLAVIEGDQQTSIDAERIRAIGVPTIQLNTGRGCHLDAHMVGHAIEDLDLKEDSVLFIENVGNLVCPANFDLGEAEKIAILSVTEGDDKPLKYPDMFAAAGTLILSKIDLLAHVDFDVERCIENARAINPRIDVLQLSARTGEGIDRWIRKLAADARQSAQLRLCHA